MSNNEELRASLKPEFMKSSLNLASKSINDWGLWSELEDFPSEGGWPEKLAFVDDTLKSALSPLQHRPNDRMFWRIRPDLNKYRGWFLNKVLQHQMAIQDGTSDKKFILPEDLPKLADDLYAFHKHHRDIGKDKGANAGPLQHYKSLTELNEAVMPYTPTFPFDAEDRIVAHDTYLEEHGGNGEAKRIAELSDGTEVIQVLSEGASRAYGTPRWCTAYRNQPTAFESYKDDLLIVIDPDGQRWQLHFRTQHFQDENDNSIGNLANFLEDKEELKEALAPYVDKELRRQAVLLSADNEFSHRSFSNIWKLALNVPAFRKRILSDAGALKDTLEFAGFGKSSHSLSASLILIKIARKDEEFKAVITPYLFDDTFNLFTKNAMDGEYGIREEYGMFWQAILAVPEWQRMAAEPERFSRMMEKLFDPDEDINTRHFLGVMQCVHKDADCSELLEPYIFDRAFRTFHDGIETSYGLRYPYKGFARMLLSNPAWRETAINSGLISKSHEAIDDAFRGVEDIKDHDAERYSREYIGQCCLMVGIPEWEAYAREQGYFQRAVDEGHLDQRFDMYEEKARSNKFWGWHPRDYNKGLWPSVLSIEEWEQHALEEDRLGRMLGILFDEELKPKRGLGFYMNEGKRNDAARTFMFMMPMFYNRAGFRDAMTPFVKEALKRSKGETASFKLKFGGGLGRLNLTAEILKYASQVREWRDQISLNDFKTALRDNKAIPSVLKWARGNISSQWREVVLQSDAVPDFLTSDEVASFEAEPVKRLIASHPPYREAFGSYVG